jgi:hypothetical protein
MAQDRRVVAEAGADVNDVIALAHGGRGDQQRMIRGHAVVQFALGHDPDQNIVVEVDRIGVGREHVAGEAQNGPGTGPEEALARHAGERFFGRRVMHTDRSHDLLGESAADNGQFCFAIHGRSLGKGCDHHTGFCTPMPVAFPAQVRSCDQLRTAKALGLEIAKY